MKRLFLVGLLLVATSSSVSARGVEDRAARYPLGTLVNAVALNAAAASRTATFSVDGDRSGYDLAALYIEHSNSSGALTVTMSCTNLPSATDSDATLQDCTIASGVCTSDDASWEKSVTTDTVWPWRVDISGFPGQIDCVFAASGAGASDTITVKGWLVTK